MTTEYLVWKLQRASDQACRWYIEQYEQAGHEEQAKLALEAYYDAREALRLAMDKQARNDNEGGSK
jgi:hypothetical protein